MCSACPCITIIHFGNAKPPTRLIQLHDATRRRRRLTRTYCPSLALHNNVEAKRSTTPQKENTTGRTAIDGGPLSVQPSPKYFFDRVITNGNNNGIMHPTNTRSRPNYTVTAACQLRPLPYRAKRGRAVPSVPRAIVSTAAQSAVNVHETGQKPRRGDRV